MKKNLLLILVINTFLCFSAYADYTFTDNTAHTDISRNDYYTYYLGSSVFIKSASMGVKTKCKI